MSWKKHFRVVPNQSSSQGPSVSSQGNDEGGGAGTASKYSSYLPEVYAGHPNRIQRYYQYDDMDRDSDINAALDTIADFCTQSEEQNENPFQINYDETANETEVKLLKTCMEKWVRLNDFKSRLWYMFRSCIKNGDAFFLRDPETFEWLWVDHYSVLMVKVDEERGKVADEYLLRGLDLNRQAKFATNKVDTSQFGLTPLGSSNAYGSRSGAGVTGGSFQMAGAHIDQRQNRPGQTQSVDDVQIVNADHMVHLSLSVGMDINWPFGASILEPIFKTYKQKELLEDAIIIYRVQRAPERRIFYIDVGNMPPVRAKAHIQAIKNEIHQRRIPNRTGGGSSILDAAYNPLSIMEDYFFAQSAEGRGSKVETLAGGDNLGEIGDLSFFTKKMARGLRIPSSYLSLGEDDGNNVAYSDGKLGAALIQEFRFNKYCMRMQSLLAPVFDAEFKRFVRENGVSVDSNLYELQFNPPQNFTKYRQIELDAAQASVYQMVAENKKLAERFKLKRFLNLTEEELLENETLWKEENASKLKKVSGTTPAESDNAADLGAIGMRSGGGMDDFGMPDETAMPDPGGDPAAAGGAPPPAPGGAPAPPPPPGGGPAMG
jgi:hypothetical protein